MTMKKLFPFLLLLAAPLWGDGPKYSYPESPKLNDEITNIYRDLRYPNAVYTRTSSMTVTQLNVSSITLNGSNFFGSVLAFRNRVINGNMAIDQANAGAAIAANTASVFFSVDQFWGTAMASAGVYTLQRSVSTPPTGINYFMRVTCTTADTSIATGDRYYVTTNIEGNNVGDFGLGTSGAVPFVLSFYVRSSLTGTYSGAFRNSANNRSYAFEYTIDSANTWERKTVRTTGDTTGTWLTDTGIGLRITWALALGSDWDITPNAWGATADAIGSTSQVNFMSSNTSRTWDITGVQLESGSTATSFEYRPYAFELFLAQRYYEKSYPIEVAPGTINADAFSYLTAFQYGTTSMESTHIPFKVPKRVTPTMTLYRYNATNTTGQWNWGTTTGTHTARTTNSDAVYLNGFHVTQAAAVEYWTIGQWVADARL